MRENNLLLAYPRPRHGGLLSLPANLTTAMLLVDYAALGNPTPTPWPRGILAGLSGGARRDLRAIEGVLAHGANLRDYALARIPGGEAPHESWPAFRDWLAHLPEADLRELVAYGFASGLAYYRERMQPIDEVEWWLESAGTREPEITTIAEALAEPARGEATARALLTSWYGADTAAAVDLALRPDRLRDALLRFLDELWERGFSESWGLAQAALREAVAAAGGGTDARGAPGGSEEMVLRVTGLQPAGEAAGAIRRAATLVFVPCLHLGRYLSVLEIAGAHYVLYEPHGSGTPQPRSPRPARQVMDLEDLGAAVVALGDPTRLAILMLLAERGDALYVQDMVQALGVHQSTLSRNLGQLERAGLVRVRREGNLKQYTLDRPRVREVCAELVQAIG